MERLILIWGNLKLSGLVDDTKEESLRKIYIFRRRSLKCSFFFGTAYDFLLVLLGAGEATHCIFALSATGSWTSSGSTIASWKKSPAALKWSTLCSLSSGRCCDERSGPGGQRPKTTNWTERSLKINRVQSTERSSNSWDTRGEADKEDDTNPFGLVWWSAVSFLTSLQPQ